MATRQQGQVRLWLRTHGLRDMAVAPQRPGRAAPMLSGTRDHSDRRGAARLERRFSGWKEWPLISRRDTTLSAHRVLETTWASPGGGDGRRMDVRPGQFQSLGGTHRLGIGRDIAGQPSRRQPKRRGRPALFGRVLQVGSLIDGALSWHRRRLLLLLAVALTPGAKGQHEKFKRVSQGR